MNNTCSIYIDNQSPVSNNVIKYLTNKYDTLFLIGNDMTTKYHDNIPYIYYNYVKYNRNIDIYFQNILDIEKLDYDNHRIGYIYDGSRHNGKHSLLLELFNKVDTVLLVDNGIPQALITDVFNYNKETIYV